MPAPRVYTPEFITEVVDRVQQHRTRAAHGAVTAVARDLGLNRRLVSTWANSAHHPPATPAPARQAADMLVGDTSAVLPPGLLYCATCAVPMGAQRSPAGGLVYQCTPGCRTRPLPASLVVRGVGRAVLATAPHLIAHAAGVKEPEIAARHADRALVRVTAGHTAHDLSFAWRSAPVHHPGASLHDAVHTARMLTGSDLHRAGEVLRLSLTAVDPTTAGAHPVQANAASLLAEILLRLGRPSAAVPWASYAHRSYTHLHGPTDSRTLAALRVAAAAHHRAGQHQRAYHLYRRLVDGLIATVGPDAHPTLTAQAHLAVVLHTLGHCAHARTLLAGTINTHQHAHPDHPATHRMEQQLTLLRQHCVDQRHHHLESH